MPSDKPDPVYDALVALERAFDLGDGFLVGLYFKETDWSFIIKCHALLEAATTQLLATHTGHGELATTFASLPQSDSRMGRIAFLRALHLLDDAQLRFLRKFSELRNDLVHDVHNTRFAFVDYLAALPDPDKGFAQWVVFGTQDPDTLRARREAAVHNPRFGLWGAVMHIVASCEDRRDQARERQIRIKEALALLDESRGDQSEDEA